MAPRIRAVAPPLSADIHRRLFDWVIGGQKYQHWKRPETSWQLRVVGGPGSGKTTLSGIILEDLNREIGGRNLAVLSLFLYHDSTTQNEIALTPFAKNFQKEVIRQLTAQAKAPSRDFVASEDPYSVIEQLISETEGVFLLVDDLDVLWSEPAEYLALENELARLQKLRVKILVTSRVPFRKSTLVAVCDVKPDEHEHLDIWWQCKLCLTSEPEYYICDICKGAGHGCLKHDHGNHHLVQPRDRVDLDVGNIPKPYMSAFIAYQMQNEHGDLGLLSPTNIHSSKDPFPPLSALGKILLAERTESVTAASLLLQSLVESAEGNITLALLRLDGAQKAETLRDVETVGDRLPPNILSMFRSVVARIQHYQERRHIPTDDLRRDLGMAAIRIIGMNQGIQGMPFARLKNELIRRHENQVGREASSEELNVTIEEVLGASTGVLVVNDSRSQMVRCYHTDFYQFANENYSEELARRFSNADEAESRRPSG